MQRCRSSTAVAVDPRAHCSMPSMPSTLSLANSISDEMLDPRTHSKAVALKEKRASSFFGKMRILTKPFHLRPREIRQVPQVPDGHGISTSEKRALSGLKTGMKFPQNP